MREVEEFLKQHGLSCAHGNKWTVRLDGMDSNTRQKIERGGNSNRL